MFGGLDIKGAAPANEKKETVPQAAKPDAAVGSAFSFLNSVAAAPAPAPTSAAASAFSFLNSAPPTQPESQTGGLSIPTPPGAATDTATGGSLSAFDFLQASTASTSKDENDAGAGKDLLWGAESTSAPSPVKASTPATAPAPAPAPAVESSVGSAFSFLSAQQPPAAIPQGKQETGASESTMTSAFPSLSTSTSAGPDGLGTTSMNIPGKVPVGSGISFGGAMTGASGQKQKKRRNRAQKVGVASGQTSSLPPPAAMAAASPARPPAVEENKLDTKEAAAEAARKAEEFMNQKMLQETKAVETTKSSEFNPADLSAVRSVDSQDEVVQAARAAAEEAKAMSRPGGNGGMFGGFLRRVSPPTLQGQSSMHGSERSASSRTPPVSQPEVKPSGTDSSAVGLKTQENSSTHSKPNIAPSSASAVEQPKKIESKPAVTSSKLKPAASTPSYEKPLAKFPSSLPSQPVKVVVAPTPVPNRNNPRDVFDAIMTNFRRQVENSMERVSHMRRQRTTLLEERFVSLAKERLATQQIAQAEAQQMAAAEKEDFELADQMQTVIDGHTREKSEVVALLESITKALEELDSQKTQVVNQVTQCFQQVREKLKDFQKEQESKESVDDTEALKKFSAISKQLSAEHDRLQQDLKHLERDETALGEERKEVETAIADQAGEYERQKGEVSEKLVSVEKEIEDLRKVLAEKQAVAAEMRKEVALHEDEILRVRVKFSRQLQRIEKKESNLQDNRIEYETEMRTWQTQKDAHDETVKAHSEATVSHEKLMSSLQKEFELAGVFESIVSEEIGAEQSPSENDELDEELAGLQAEVVECEAAVTEAKEVLKAATAALKNLEMEHQTLVSRIPELEATKKAAAARRDFKTAGKASKEFKEVSARLVECEKELTSDAVDRKNDAEEHLKKLGLTLEEKRKVTTEKERKSAVAAMQKLADRIKNLVVTKNSVCGESSENNIQGVGGFVLDEQIKALRLEGQSYGEKYGGWEELDVTVSKKDVEGDMKANEEPIQKADEAAEAADVTKEEPGDKQESKNESIKDKLSKFRMLTNKIKEAEEKLEVAVEQEDYELAAELDEALQKYLADVEAMSLTDEEMEAALMEGDGENDVPIEDQKGAVETDEGAREEKNGDGDNEEEPVEGGGEEDKSKDAGMQKEAIDNEATEENEDKEENTKKRQDVEVDDHSEEWVAVKDDNIDEKPSDQKGIEEAAGEAVKEVVDDLDVVNEDEIAVDVQQ